MSLFTDVPSIAWTSNRLNGSQSPLLDPLVPPSSLAPVLGDPALSDLAAAVATYIAAREAVADAEDAIDAATEAHARARAQYVADRTAYGEIIEAGGKASAPKLPATDDELALSVSVLEAAVRRRVAQAIEAKTAYEATLLDAAPAVYTAARALSGPALAAFDAASLAVASAWQDVEDARAAASVAVHVSATASARSGSLAHLAPDSPIVQSEASASWSWSLPEDLLHLGAAPASVSPALAALADAATVRRWEAVVAAPGAVRWLSGVSAVLDVSDDLDSPEAIEAEAAMLKAKYAASEVTA
jgi:hypothetical protein